MWLLDHEEVGLLERTKPGSLYFDLMRRPLRLDCPAHASSPMAATNYGDVFTALAVLIMLSRRPESRAQTLPRRPVFPPRSMGSYPVVQYMDIPLPYMLNSDKDILTCHLPKMATKQFIEDGEWVGYRYVSWTDSPIYVYPAMMKINFRIKARKRHGAFGLFALDASDEGGPFVLDGVFYADIGRMFMTKIYLDEDESKWTMSLAVTPFGLVGSWSYLGDDRIIDMRGWLWLWKRSWSSRRR